MLRNDIWARICGKRPRDILCRACVCERFTLTYRRELRIDDLKPCPINVICGAYFALAPPGRILADWARYVVEEMQRRDGQASGERRSPATKEEGMDNVVKFPPPKVRVRSSDGSTPVMTFNEMLTFLAERRINELPEEERAAAWASFQKQVLAPAVVED
jgi:hypothetical protein